MPAPSRLRVLLVAPLTVLLSGCPLPIPPFFGFDPLIPGFGTSGDTIVVENRSDREWVVTFDLSFYPQSFAVPANRTAKAVLYEGEPRSVTLADRDCQGVTTLDEVEDLAALRIEADGRMVVADPPPDPSDLPSLLEYFECAAFGQAPELGEVVPAARGTLQLLGSDGAGWLLVPATGSLERVMDPPRDGYDTELAWSPDGSRLAFGRFDESASGPMIYVLDAPAAEPRLLVENAMSPTWSPDGTRIAYLSADPFAGGSTLLVIDADGGEPRMLTADAGMPAWSPDGTRIAYTTVSESFADPFGDVTEELRVIPADGGEPITLDEAMPYGPPPRWSPDGRTIAYSSGSLMRGEVRVISAEGGQPRILDAPSDTIFGEPAWSSDGRRLAVTTTDVGLFGTGGGVAVVDVASGEVEMLIEDRASVYSMPAWSPDDAFVAVLALDMSIDSGLVLIGVGDGSVTEVASGVMAIAGWRP